jgi:hypothetical protein
MPAALCTASPLVEASEESISVHRLVQKVVRDEAEARGETTGPVAGA